MKKLLNYIGLYSRNQYKGLEEKLKQTEAKKTEVETKTEALVFDFDTLLAKYGPKQLNALYYKLINLVRNDSTKRFLLDRWSGRLQDAHKTSS